MTCLPVRQVYLQPAGLCLADEPAVIQTVLGSCISVTLWDPVTRLAAVSHCVYPEPHRTGPAGEDARFVTLCIPRMLDWMAGRGVTARRLETKLFGGAACIGWGGTWERSIGRLNVEAAERCLAAAGLTVKAAWTGGSEGRKLVFSTLTGEAWVKRLGRRSTEVS